MKLFHRVRNISSSCVGLGTWKDIVEDKEGHRKILCRSRDIAIYFI